ncbi:hypothetical protein CP965_13765 [Halarcobacter mediterraneus]|uniref:Uncharacterized protein n=1 Tax=Halarcobacter mediterraneus TaxID=2023153 RepID=A0A4Q1AZC4_9BACT|nr:hypothetical protein [Halarcobacter mediterraneus]RXK11496.1 hypothetical protein CP965_13765 [Halarcobacter mediterraneus]
MQTDKTEKLKEALRETLTQEEIQKKLKKESPSDNKKTKSSEIKNPKDIKIKNTNDLRFTNYLIYALCFIIIVLAALVIYLIMYNENSVKIVYKETKQEPEVIVKEIIKPKEIEVIKQEIVKEVETKIVDLDNKNFRKYYYTQKTRSLKCYDFKADSSIISQECKNKITNFIKKNTDFTRVEVIAVVANDDNVLFNKIQNDIKNQNEAIKKRVQEYLLRGISRQRVIEVSSFIRKNLDKYVVVTPTNYYVTSAKTNKGVIIKGFYTPNNNKQ